MFRSFASNRLRVIVLAALGVIAVFGSITWALAERSHRKSLQVAFEASYQRSFLDMATSAENLEVLLAKAIASSSPQRISSLLHQSWYQADRTRERLAELPVGKTDTTAIQRLLAQCGDYCLSLAQQLGEGRGLAPKQWEELVRLHQIMGGFVERLSEIRSSPTPRERQPAPPSRTSRIGALFGVLFPKADRREAADLGYQLSAVERDLKQFDALVYDGPFSAHLETKHQVSLPGNPVTSGAAVEKALQFLAKALQVGGSPDSERNKRQPKVVSVEAFGGPIPSYAVRLQIAGSPPRVVEVDVSQRGGHALLMIDPRPVGGPTTDRQRAEEVARRFLASTGFSSLEVTGVNRNGNLLTISFAPVEDDAILYPDTVRVTVALDDGQIVAYDAVAYWQNHRTREFGTAKLTPSDISLLINPRATVEGIRKAVIRSPSGKEVMTYQAKLNLSGERFLSFLNVNTGVEEAILKVVEGKDRFITR